MSQAPKLFSMDTWAKFKDVGKVKGSDLFVEPSSILAMTSLLVNGTKLHLVSGEAQYVNETVADVEAEINRALECKLVKSGKELREAFEKIKKRIDEDEVLSMNDFAIKDVN